MTELPAKAFTGFIDEIFDLQGVRHEGATLHGEIHVAAVSVEEPDADITLQLGDTTADSRLRHVQLPRRLRKAARPGNGEKIADVVEVHLGGQGINRGIL